MFLHLQPIICCDCDRSRVKVVLTFGGRGHVQKGMTMLQWAYLCTSGRVLLGVTMVQCMGQASDHVMWVCTIESQMSQGALWIGKVNKLPILIQSTCIQASNINLLNLNTSTVLYKAIRQKQLKLTAQLSYI